MHHRGATLGLQCWNFLFGGANRIAAFSGLYMIGRSLGASHDVAAASAGLVTGLSVISSNLLAVEAANEVEFAGIQTHWDVITLVPVLTATCVDVIMTWSSGVWMPARVLLAVGIGVGLPTVLFKKVRYIVNAVRGYNVKAENLRAEVPALVHEVGQYMVEHGITMQDEDFDNRRDAYHYFLSGADRETFLQKVLHRTCLSSKVNARKNTLLSLLNSGLLDNGEDENILRLLEENAENQHEGALGHLLTGLGLIVVAVPCALYGWADADTFVQVTLWRGSLLWAQ